MIEFKKYSIWKKKDERILITFVYRNNDIQCKNYNDFKKKMMKIIIKKLMIKNSIFAIIITKINYIYNFYLYKAIL